MSCFGSSPVRIETTLSPSKPKTYDVRGPTACETSGVVHPAAVRLLHLDPGRAARAVLDRGLAGRRDLVGGHAQPERPLAVVGQHVVAPEPGDERAHLAQLLGEPV